MVNVFREHKDTLSFDICSRSAALPQRLFVEASAGTGKTFLIEHYVVRAALNGTFKPNELILVTFTKAVARELRLRLEKTLEKTREFLEKATSCPPPEYVQTILEADEFERKKIARYIDETIDRLPEATISTIHGFCDHLLQLWEEKSGSTGSSDWITDEQKKEWVKEFIQEGSSITPFELDALSTRYWHRQEALIDLLVTGLEENIDQEDLSWQTTEQALLRIRETINSASIASSLGQKASGFRGNTTKEGRLKREPAQAFSAIQALVEQGLSDETLEPLFNVSCEKFFSAPLKKQEPLSPDVALICDLIEKDLWPHLKELTHTEDILRRLQLRCSKAFTSFITSRHLKTPQSVVRRVFDLTTHEPFRTMAAETTGYLIVDEFQDTDATQYGILSSLFLNNPSWKGHVLFVGDPKQAIYGFRKADVYSYLAAKQSMPQSTIETLSVNYRSEPGVVEAQNHIFTNPGLFSLPESASSIHVIPNTSGQKPQQPLNDSRGAIHLCLCHGNLGRKRRWPHDELEQTALFPWLADEMIALSQKGIPFSQQAVLVKDRYQAKRVQNFFENRHIPTCAWRVDSVHDTPIADWLSKALHLAIRPHDQQRLISLLLSIPNDNHIALCRSVASENRLDQWASCALAWKTVHDAFYSKGISAMARTLFSCIWNGRETVEEWLNALPHGPTHILDLEHLFDLLSTLEPKLPRSIEAYQEALANLPRFFSEEPELLIRRTDPNDQGAPILTMHRSKGLEFDVVFALGGACRTPLQDEMNLDEADAEKIRQLYVSVTRAKRRCYLPFLIDDDQRAVPSGHNSPIELLCHKLSEPSEDVLKAAATFLTNSTPTITLSNIREELRNLSVEPIQPVIVSASSPPKLPSHSRTYESFTSKKAETLLLEKPILNRSIGTPFHEAIARLLFAPPSARTSPESICSWLSLDDPELCRLLHAAVHTSLPFQGGTLSLEAIPRSDLRVECAFLDPKGPSKYERGTLDLLIVVQGTVYVVDWKTHEAPTDSLEELVNQSYNVQATMYRQAVERAFKMPLGGFFFVFVRQLPGGIVCR